MTRRRRRGEHCTELQREAGASSQDKLPEPLDTSALELEQLGWGTATPTVNVTGGSCASQQCNTGSCHEISIALRTSAQGDVAEHGWRQYLRQLPKASNNDVRLDNMMAALGVKAPG